MTAQPLQNAFDSRTLPKARSFQVHTCGKCPNVHVIFFADDGEAVYQAVLSSRQARDIFVKALRAEQEVGTSDGDKNEEIHPISTKDGLSNMTKKQRSWLYGEDDLENEDGH